MLFKLLLISVSSSSWQKFGFLFPLKTLATFRSTSLRRNHVQFYDQLAFAQPVSFCFLLFLSCWFTERRIHKMSSSNLSAMKSPTSPQSDLEAVKAEEAKKERKSTESLTPVKGINPASDVNARLDTQVEVRVYPCNNSGQGGGKKKFTSFTIKPEVCSYLFCSRVQMSFRFSISQNFLFDSLGSHHSRI